MSTCETCSHYEANKDQHGSTGFCRRYPPVLFPVPKPHIAGAPPGLVMQAFRVPVAANETCGEFAPRIRTKECAL